MPEQKSLDQMFETCTTVMREKKQPITSDYLAEEVSDCFHIFDADPSMVLPGWVVASAKEWLSKQVWFIPDEDGHFYP